MLLGLLLFFLAILSGATCCDNPSCTMGIREKDHCKISYSLIPNLFLIYLSLCLWLKMHTIYNYAFWMEGPENLNFQFMHCFVEDVLYQHGSKLNAFGCKLMLGINNLSQELLHTQSQITIYTHRIDILWEILI